MAKHAIEIHDLTKKFDARTILNKLSLTVDEGEFVAVVGPSGCGKSTLLNILGLLEEPTDGRILIFDEAVPAINSKKATLWRRSVINYLFQSFALIDDLSVKDNLLLAMNFVQKAPASKEKLITQVLAELEISYLLNAKVASLSGGEQQRVALARTILKPGKLVLADEPTGALDQKHAQMAFDQIELLRSKYHKTVLMVTHNLDQARQCDRIITLMPNSKL